MREENQLHHIMRPITFLAAEWRIRLDYGVLRLSFLCFFTLETANIRQLMEKTVNMIFECTALPDAGKFPASA
jgi:hypothetical protein